MSNLPSIVQTGPMLKKRPLSVSAYLESLGWRRVHQGKVRDTYAHSDWPDHLLVIATDRLSIYDFVLPVEVPGKGEVLTALTHFWLTTVLADVPNHCCPISKSDFPADLPFERAMLVKKLEMQPYELIFRGHLGGSVWKQYQESGIVAGQHLPQGLTRWKRLAQPIFTPSTKATIGHDENITASAYFEATGLLGRRTVGGLTQAYKKAYKYAMDRGVIILDTKFEVGDPFVLADEVLTPDSSRFTTCEDYELALTEGRDPISFDKQVVRDWGRTYNFKLNKAGTAEEEVIVGIDKLDPADPRHLIYVHNALVGKIPSRVIDIMVQRYHRIFEMLVGMPLEQYQRTAMGVSV